MTDIKIPGVSRADVLRAELRHDAQKAKRDAALLASAAPLPSLQPGPVTHVPTTDPAPVVKRPWEGLRVCIGIPSGDMIHTDFAFCMAGLILQSAMMGINNAAANAKSTYVHAGRNILVEQAQALGATHLLFLDSDMTFPYDALARLLSHKKDIVGATYVRRRYPHGLLGSKIDGSGEVPTTGLIQMAEMPTGCLLIKMDCFDLIEKPFFRHKVKDDLMIGEDILFCRTMTALGKTIWCDMDLSMHLGHLGQEKFTILGTHMKAMEGVPALKPTMPMPGHASVVTPV